MKKIVKKLLLQYNPNLYIKDHKGRTALFHAQLRNKNGLISQSITELLEEAHQQEVSQTLQENFGKIESAPALDKDTAELTAKFTY
ncbi:MAG: hypothetical protein WCD44_02565 [Candidatus Babeliales bacterium]